MESQRRAKHAAERHHAELLARLPPEWEEYFTDAGVPYYCNTATGESLWAAPQIDPDAEPEEEEEEEPEELEMDQVELPTSAMAANPAGINFQELAMRQQQVDTLPVGRSQPSFAVERAEVDEAAAEEQQRAEEEVAEALKAVVETPFEESEKVALVRHVNWALRDDAHVGQLLPLDPHADADAARSLFGAAGSGLLLSKFVKHVDDEAVDARALNVASPLSEPAKLQNHTLCIGAATSIGCGVPNLQPSQLRRGAENEQVVLQLLWNLTRDELTRGLNPATHPEFFRLLLPNEEMSAMTKLLPEQVMLRWLNHHIRMFVSENPGQTAVPADFAVSNLHDDLADSVALAVVLKQVAPAHFETDLSALDEADREARAAKVIADAKLVGVERFEVSPSDIATPRPRMTLAFLAAIINAFPGLEPVAGFKLGDIMAGEPTDGREERAFRMWMQSLGLNLTISNLYEDCRTGLPVLKIEDRLQPGIVDWARVNMAPKSIYTCVENCNYALEIFGQVELAKAQAGVTVSGPQSPPKGGGAPPGGRKEKIGSVEVER